MTVSLDSFVSPTCEALVISLSMFIAEHNLPFASLDHLNQLLKKRIPNSKIVKNMCINRQKGQNIIKSITEPTNSAEISKITKNQYYPKTWL